MKFKVPQPYTPSERDITNILAPAGLEVSSNNIKLGDYFLKTLFLFTYPRYLSSGWFSPIINLAEMMDITIFVHPMDTALALRGLKRKIAQVSSEVSEREDKGLVRDPILETAHQDIENLRDALQQAREKLFQVGVYVTIYGRSVEELGRLEQKIQSMLEARLVYVKPALFRQLEGFQTTIPLATDKLQVLTPLNSGPASSLFPFVSPDLTSDDGILYGVNMHNQSLIIFDRFSLENANTAIFAKSGAGKSYAAKLNILRALMMGTDVIVIDPENEYQKLANTIGGSYFKISLTVLIGFLYHFRNT